MPRKIFITEEMADKLLEANDVSEKLVNCIENQGPFKDNEAIPTMDGISFVHKMAIKSYDLAKKGVSDEFLALTVEEKKNLLSKITTRCQEIESANRKVLEKLCFNVVNKMFAIPNGVITFKCHLVNDVSSKERDLRAKPEDTPGMQYDSISEMKSLRKEVYKRRILNAIIMGMSLYYSKLPKQFIGEVYEIDPELPKLYNDFISLNLLTLYEQDSLPNITEQNKMQSGLVEVRVAGVGKRTLIESYGTIFPVLLSESIRGFLELFASHGLPENKEAAEYIMKKTDNVESDVYNMIVGPGIWADVFLPLFDEVSIKYLPLWFTKISELDGGEFCEIMQEVFGNTRSGTDIMQDLMRNVVDEIDYEDFEDSLAMKNMNKNMISDEYLTPEELDLI